MRIIDDAGLDITKKAIWKDRELLLKNVKDPRLKEWLTKRRRQ